MADRPVERATESDVPRERKVEDLYEMIEEIGTCMFTTRRADGLLVSRPMQVQLRTEDGELWFVTDEDTAKLDELHTDAHVNLAFFDPGSRDWISVSAIAHSTGDRERIHALHDPSWRAWFTDEGGDRNGGPDDPRIVLIQVTPVTVTYLRNDTPRPVAMFKVSSAGVKGSAPEVGSSPRHVSERELRDRELGERG